MQGPDSCVACSRTFVDAGTRDACSNKSMTEQICAEVWAAGRGIRDKLA